MTSQYYFCQFEPPPPPGSASWTGQCNTLLEYIQGIAVNYALHGVRLDNCCVDGESFSLLFRQGCKPGGGTLPSTGPILWADTPCGDVSITLRTIDQTSSLIGDMARVTQTVASVD